MITREVSFPSKKQKCKGEKDSIIRSSCTPHLPLLPPKLCPIISIASGMDACNIWTCPSKEETLILINETGIQLAFLSFFLYLLFLYNYGRLQSFRMDGGEAITEQAVTVILRPSEEWQSGLLRVINITVNSISIVCAVVVLSIVLFMWIYDVRLVDRLTFRLQALAALNNTLLAAVFIVQTFTDSSQYALCQAVVFLAVFFSNNYVFLNCVSIAASTAAVTKYSDGLFFRQLHSIFNGYFYKKDIRMQCLRNGKCVTISGAYLVTLSKI